MSNQIIISEIKDTMQDSNINFLIGSGMSSPYFELLGNIEILLTELSKRELNEKESKIIEASLYKSYFEGVIAKNIDVLQNDIGAKTVQDGYTKLFQSINSILLNRNTIVGKQVNVFTTNIDIFQEKATEEISVECNDGFCGRFSPTFSLGNFKKSCFRTSLHYDNTSEIPVFNLLKLHGSVSWKLGSNGKEILFSPTLELIKTIAELIPPADGLVKIDKDSTIESVINEAKKIKIYHKMKIRSFLSIYKELLIINPTKEKFKDTLFNQTYYDMLRVFSNELEKENTVLFAMGFSFEDEHLRELTLRAVDSNPTLTLYVIAHTSLSVPKYQSKLRIDHAKNKNIKIISPEKKTSADGTETDEYAFDLSNINKNIFDLLLTHIQTQDGEEIPAIIEEPHE